MKEENRVVLLSAIIRKISIIFAMWFLRWMMEYLQEMNDAKENK